MKIEQSKFPRGSEWRRWDLHVHTPESVLGSSFVGVDWDSYVDAIEAAALAEDIAVIGVTDYLTIDGYVRLLAEKTSQSKPRLSSVEMLLPNIELRAAPQTGDGKALNIHILVNPADPEHTNQIRKALKNLRVEHDGYWYGCSKEEFMEFGRALTPGANDTEAYVVGVQQFKPSYQQIIEWLDSEKWLRTNSLVGVANGKDGISGLPHDGFAAAREQLLKRSHIVFSGNPGDREHYLGKKNGVPKEEVLRMYRSLKPCLHGSDAHEIAKLFKPDLERNCWIKADPTFEGLRQVLWEPDCRVRIGTISPSAGDQTRYIKSVSFSGLNKWFPAQELELNSSLVAVIGEKGAGKTAIADLIAFAAGEAAKPTSQTSFITKGRLHLDKGKVELTWGNGSKTKGTLTSHPFATPKPLVRYLSQDFVERLCSTDSEGKELQRAIEEVVFSHLLETQKEGFSSFEELRQARELSSQARRDDLRGQLASLHREVERLESQIDQIPAKKALVCQIDNQRGELEKQLPNIESHADKSVLDALAIEVGKLEAIESEVSKLTRRKRRIEEFQKSYRAAREKATKQIQELIATTPIHQLDANLTMEALLPTWNSDVDARIQALVERTQADIDLKTGIDGPLEAGGDSDNAPPTIKQLSARINQLREFVSKDETNRKQLLDLQKQISENTSSAKRIRKEIKHLENDVTSQAATKREERIVAFSNFFESLTEDANGLEELYKPMKLQIEALGSDIKFELRTGNRLQLREWLEKSGRFYDGRKPNAARKRDEIEKFAIDRLSPALRSGNATSIKAVMQEFYALVSPAKFMADIAVPTLKLVDLFDWMFSIDHVGTTYKILYGGVELEHLSPGTRGIALLVLYLLMDEDDRRPLIIDQPEGNLDNASVFSQLVPYIRKAKEKRQIILVTHNPNLVVTTDAEQIIVAVADRPSSQSHPRIHYVSGSLEHSKDGEPMGLRQSVCLLLEGGTSAFRDRESRYSITATAK